MMKIVMPEQVQLEPSLLELVENNTVLASILWNRGYRTPEEVKPFLDPAFYSPADPCSLPGIETAVEIISSSLEAGEKICVYGDYDVDGITATALLVRTLNSLGARVSYHLPNRFTEGYGLSSKVIRELAAAGCQLLLTCDCGISNHEEVALANELGMKVVVTDHHSLPDQPVPAAVIVNPKMLEPDHPCRDLPGVGVAYLLAVALCRSLGRSFDERLLQLVALGIVADVVPLCKENRYLLQRGLATLNSEKILPGLEALQRICNLPEIDEERIGFQLGPRLNAPGRVLAPDICVELLLCDDSAEARSLAAEIDLLNTRRRQLVDSIMEDLQDLKADGSVVTFNEFWHQGVIGIAAGRLTEDFQVPAVLMTVKQDGSSTVVGSARSPEGINIFECLQEVGEYLDKFGGHAGAAGFSLQRSNLDAFTKALKAELDRYLHLAASSELIAVDAEIPLSDITLENYNLLRRLAPFGEGNPAPRFYTPDVEIATCRSIGDGKHQRLTLSQGEDTVTALWWWNQEECEPGSQADVVYTLNKNIFNGTVSVQMVLDCLVEGERIPKVETAEEGLQVIDCRFAAGESVELPAGPGVCSFAEREKRSGTVNRFELHKCDTLVLTEIPPHLTVLKEMISLTRCRKLVLGYPRQLPQSKPFLIRLMGVLKHVAKNGGSTTLEHLASATGELEITVMMGMRTLREAGYLNWEPTGSYIQLSLLDGEKISTRSRNYQRMREAEQETLAFREFAASAEPELIKKML